MSVGDESRFLVYPADRRLRIPRLPGERFQQMCQAYRVQAGVGSVHVWGAFHSGAKSPLVLHDRYLSGELYRGILWNTLVSFVWHHFRDDYRYQDGNATPHHARVVLDFLQQGNVTKMEQPARSPDLQPHNIFGINWAVRSPVWTTHPRFLVRSPKPCWINGQNPYRTPIMPCSNHATTPCGDYRS